MSKKCDRSTSTAISTSSPMWTRDRGPNAATHFTPVSCWTWSSSAPVSLAISLVSSVTTGRPGKVKCTTICEPRASVRVTLPLIR